jgi:hypothetical protein
MRDMSLFLFSVVLLAIPRVVSADSLLEKLANKDIRHSSSIERAGLEMLLLAHQPERDRPRIKLKPRYILRHQLANGAHSYIVFAEYPVMFGDSPRFAQVHIFDADTNLLGSTKISIGYRRSLKAVAYRQDAVLGIPILDVNTTNFLRIEGDNREIYAVMDDRISLLRIEDKSGKLIPNDFGNDEATIGATPPLRTAEEWEAALASHHAWIVLESLTWVGGRHKYVEKVVHRELNEEQKVKLLVFAVRERAAVVNLIAKHAQSDIPWIREAAEAAIEELRRKN